MAQSELGPYERMTDQQKREYFRRLITTVSAPESLPLNKPVEAASKVSELFEDFVVGLIANSNLVICTNSNCTREGCTLVRQIRAKLNAQPDLLCKPSQADELRLAIVTRDVEMAQVYEKSQVLLAALRAMCEEYRHLDLPYGSKAYANAIAAILKTKTNEVI